MSRVEQRFALANHIPVIRPSGQPAAVQNRSRRFCADQLEVKVASAKSRIDHLTQSMDSRVPALGPSAQPAAAQYRSRRYCLAKALLAPPCGRPKSFPTILSGRTGAASPQRRTGQRAAGAHCSAHPCAPTRPTGVPCCSRRQGQKGVCVSDAGEAASVHRTSQQGGRT